MDLIVLLVLLVALAFIPATIASRKGRDGQTWFLLGLFVWPVAMIASLLVRDLRPEQEMKVCPDCAEMVYNEARVCRFCGYRFARDA